MHRSLAHMPKRQTIGTKFPWYSTGRAIGNGRSSTTRLRVWYTALRSWIGTPTAATKSLVLDSTAFSYTRQARTVNGPAPKSRKVTLRRGRKVDRATSPWAGSATSDIWRPSNHGTEIKSLFIAKVAEHGSAR